LTLTPTYRGEKSALNDAAKQSTDHPTQPPARNDRHKKRSSAGLSLANAAVEPTNNDNNDVRFINETINVMTPKTQP
jgi:hypothetical protein